MLGRPGRGLLDQRALAIASGSEHLVGERDRADCRVPERGLARALDAYLVPTPQSGELAAGEARRVGTPDDIAQAFSSVMHNGFITATVLHVDGGHRIT